MLKNCFLPTQYDSFTSKTCGEIVCQSETSFTIVCKFCDIKIFEFDEFLHHFRITHWNESKFADSVMNEIVEESRRSPGQIYGSEYIKTEEHDEPNFYEEYNFSEPSNDDGDQDVWTPIKDDGKYYSDDDSTDSETIAIIKKKLKSNVESGNTFTCNLCPQTFTNKSNYQSHLRKHKTDRFKCDKCGKSFTREVQLTHHLNTHNGYSCKLCAKVFKSYDSLRYHKETHIQTKNFVCDFKDCNKAFATKRRMHSHKRLHFSEDFVCEVCGSRQRNKQALMAHIHKHTGEKPFACNSCDRRFTTKSLMNEHKACHETERKHVCDVCGKSFNRPKALYHHKPLHLDVKKFVCKLCGAAYAQAAGLSAHMRKHKEDKITYPEEKSTINNIFSVLFPKSV